MSTGKPNRESNRELLPGLLTALFGVRVVGQAVQRWLPQSYLPPFGAFQGSRLPYPLLLLAQLAILSLMVRVCRRAWQSTLRRNAVTARTLGWVGAFYMAGSLLRIAIGVMAPSASAWFRAWVPGTFHVILAAFVLCLARAYRQPQLPWPGRPAGE